MQTAPFGAWISPLSPEALTTGGVGLGAGTVDQGQTYWLESRPDQGGRASIWVEDADGARTELTPEHYVRTMVHEYGGGAWNVRDGIVVFSSFPSHQLFVLRDGRITPLTPERSALRYADLQVHPARGLVLAVREDHTDSDLHAETTVVALQLDGDNADGGTVLASGADFYAAPRLSDDGRLAWVEWDHPNMPWDATRLMTGRLADDAASVNEVCLLTSGESAAAHPVWDGDDLLFLDDVSGYWNFYRLRGGAVARLQTDDHDYCLGAWTFGDAYVVLPGGRIACFRAEGGRRQLGYVERDGSFTPHPEQTSDGALGGGEGRLVASLAWPDRAPTLERIDPVTGASERLREAFDLDLDPGTISVAQSRTWQSPQGEVQGWFYPPANADFVGPDGALPPLRVLVHGGPTGFASNAFRLAVQFWTSRGFAVLDVNYGGSAGFGREYRNRLRGNWGVVDVADCVQGAQELVKAGLVDAAKVSIEGGSAGGYTTLAALTTSDVFAAGISRYGIADVSVLATDTHKFELRYPIGLIGGADDAELQQRYRDRSPINHLDGLSCPMLIEQGTEDRVVPPNQAKLMADAVRAQGLPVALVMYEGEGHGWRKAETIVRAAENELSFYGQVYGFEPYGVPKLEIENLS